MPARTSVHTHAHGMFTRAHVCGQARVTVWRAHTLYDPAGRMHGSTPHSLVLHAGRQTCSRTPAPTYQARRVLLRRGTYGPCADRRALTADGACSPCKVPSGSKSDIKALIKTLPGVQPQH